MKSKTFPNTWYNPTRAEIRESGVEAPIAFDFDGVLSETETILYDGICKLFEVEDIRQKENGYNMFNYAVDGVSNKTMFAAINTIIGEEAGGALPSPYMSEVLDYVYATTGRPITIVTSRTKENMDVTYQWLQNNLSTGVPFNLILANGMQKEVVLKRIKCNMFIDDRYKTVAKLEQEIDLAVLYKRPWNQGRPVEAGDFTIRDLREIIPIVNYLSRQYLMRWPGNVPYPNRLGYGIGVQYD